MVVMGKVVQVHLPEMSGLKCHGSMEANNEKEREEANLCQAGERCLSISRIGSWLGVGGEVRGSGEAGSALEDVL
jgi:hypothetical protein